MQKSYVLQLEYMTKAYFQDFLSDGVKIVVSSDTDAKFHKLHTESDISEHDINKECEKYKDYEYFYLNIDFEHDSYVHFELSDIPGGLSLPDLTETCIASVYIPKNNKNILSTEFREMYLEHLQNTLENYYNNTNCWLLLVLGQDNDAVKSKPATVADDYLLFYDDNRFSEEDETWFKTCHKKYGITEEEISAAKNIIRSYNHRILQKISEDSDTYLIKNNTKE